MKLANHMNNFVDTKWKTGIYKFGEIIANVNSIDLTLGEPNFPTPQHIKDAAIRAIQDDQSHYTNPEGCSSLLVNASDFLKRKYGLNYDPKSQILTTIGVSEGIATTLTAILNPGDEVIIPTPTYPAYISNTLVHGAKAVLVNTAKDGFLLTPKLLKATLAKHPKAKAIILNYPSNPTGKTYGAEQLKALADVIKQYPVFCICDEIYSELTYQHHHVSLAKYLPDQTIVFNGVSKTYAMTGWRIGLVCGPKDVIAKINKLHNVVICSATTCAQYAASEAFKNGDQDDMEMHNVYQQRLKILEAGLDKLGLSYPKPSGAFYVFAKLPKRFHGDDYTFALQLAHQVHVGVVPGSVFGPGGEGYVRISYSASTQDIKKGLQQIKKFLQNN